MSLGIVGCEVGDNEVEVGWISDDGRTFSAVSSLREFWESPELNLSREVRGPTKDADGLRLVPPVLPGARVLCVGLNYRDHVAEGSYAADPPVDHPTIFGRWSASLSVGDADVPIPKNEPGLDWEGEIVAWVGRELSEVGPDEALASVIGYSTFNDLTARRAQKLTSQWTLGKNGDLSGPLGPIVPAARVGDLRDGLAIETRVNGEVVQSANSRQMIHTVGNTLSLISQYFTLHAGDLLATGTPSGVGYARQPPWLLTSGDIVEVEVERLGTLRNRVVELS